MNPSQMSLWLAFLFLAPDSFSARCISVRDGDTIEVLRDNRAIRVRLEGVDCPELGQGFSQKAKQFTSGLVFGKTVKIRPIGNDEYGRLIARVVVDGKDVSEELLKAGLAWHFKKYNHDQDLAELERKASKDRIGLWSLSNPIAPWDHRHRASVAPSVPAESGAARVYHGNVSSHVFHAPHCAQYNCKNCTTELPSREAAVAAGFRPCGICRP
jgi:micrococcal nuclease